MAILFEWYENPVAPNQPQEETKLPERKDRNRPIATQNPRTLFTDGNGCVRRARRPVSCNGWRTGGGQAGTSGWYRLLPPYPDLHGRNKRRYKAEEYESKAERHQIPDGSGSEEWNRKCETEEYKTQWTLQQIIGRRNRPPTDRLLQSAPHDDKKWFPKGMRHDEVDCNGAYPPFTRGRKAKKHRITEPTDICAKCGILRYNRRSYDVKM